MTQSPNTQLENISTSFLQFRIMQTAWFKKKWIKPPLFSYFWLKDENELKSQHVTLYYFTSFYIKFYSSPKFLHVAVIKTQTPVNSFSSFSLCILHDAHQHLCLDESVHMWLSRCPARCLGKCSVLLIIILCVLFRLFFIKDGLSFVFLSATLMWGNALVKKKKTPQISTKGTGCELDKLFHR